MLRVRDTFSKIAALKVEPITGSTITIFPSLTASAKFRRLARNDCRSVLTSTPRYYVNLSAGTIIFLARCIIQESFPEGQLRNCVR